MAADVTLVSIPDRDYEVVGRTFTAPGLIEVWKENVLFDDESKVDLGEGYYYLEGPGEVRTAFQHWFWDQMGHGFDNFEVGPWSPMKQGLGLEELYGGNFIPGPTAAMYKAFCEGRKVTAGVVSKAANLMSYPMGPTFYRGKNWRPGPGQRRRQTVRWLRGHIGDYVFAQSW